VLGQCSVYDEDREEEAVAVQEIPEIIGGWGEGGNGCDRVAASR